METGRVTFFHKTKQFGFLLTEKKVRLFFHLEGGGATKVNDDGTLSFKIGEDSQEPIAGDVIIFVYDNRGRRGPKANPWWIVPKRSSFLKKETRYRLKEFYRSWGTPFDESREEGKVIWEGNDLLELSTMFPHATHGNSSFDGIDYLLRFERYTSNGWEPCDDPRAYFTECSLWTRGREKFWAPPKK